MFFKIINANGQLEVNNAGDNSKFTGIIGKVLRQCSKE